MNNPKLGVDVVSAHGLMAKDGQGSSSACVELHFDGQKFSTTIKERDLNPVWNESVYFNINNPSNLQNLALEAYVYHNVQGAHSPYSLLGKVRLTSGTSFVSYSDAVVLDYPLEKGGIQSRGTGELGLKVYIMDDPSIRSSNPNLAMESFANSAPHTTNHNQVHQHQAPSSVLNPFSNDRAEGQCQFPEQQHNHQEPQYTPMNQQPSGEMRAEPQQPKIVRMYSSSSAQPPVDYKETSPVLGESQIVGGRVIRCDKPSSTCGLVEKMLFLFVRVVKARDLPSVDIRGSLDPYVKVRIGNDKGTTKHFEQKKNPEWNEVFAFSRERIQASVLEVVVTDKDFEKDDFVGILRFDLHAIPNRVPPDSPFAPEWYWLEDKKGAKSKSELMLAVWRGTQADEALPDAWRSDAATSLDISASAFTNIRSTVYHAPRLWYVRVNIIEAQDLIPTEKNHFPDVFVKAQIGSQVLKTKTIQSSSLNQLWNEDLLFIAAEPFEDPLILTVEDRVTANKDEIIGRAFIRLNQVEKRADDRMIHTRWFDLEKPVVVDIDQIKKETFSSRIHLSVCLDGGYHVHDESTHYSSDLLPTVKELWKPSIGALELGILNADGLLPMKIRDGKGTSDTYCVAKYGRKWVRSRTIIDSLSPKYNEQYTWEVYDPATVLTIGVFDNAQLGERGSIPSRDMKIGKVRIRISTLETGRVYTHSYPLLVLQPSGVKKMGELHLTIRFSCTSLVNRMYTYSRPLLPKMHYLRPLTVAQLEMLRHQAVTIVAARLSRAEPPLRKEVVEYMSDVDSHLWSMRRSKAIFFRLMSVLSGLFAVHKWFGDVCMWKNPVTTVLVHVFFVMPVCFPEYILPAIFLYMFLIGIWNFRYRPRSPSHVNTRISSAEAVHPDELDEEFDLFPTSRSPELVRMRYDRLRSVAGRVQTVAGDIVTQGERILALLSWRDPCATSIFVAFCLVAALVLFVTPLKVIVFISGFYFMRHPRFRHGLPSVPINFFSRLPAKKDNML